MSNSLRPHRRQPTRLCHPWDSPGKNTGVGCHFLFQCMKVKSESEVAQSCPTLRDPMDCSLPGSSVHGIFQARVSLPYNLAIPVLGSIKRFTCTKQANKQKKKKKEKENNIVRKKKKRESCPKVCLTSHEQECAILFLVATNWKHPNGLYKLESTHTKLLPRGIQRNEEQPQWKLDG